MTIGQETAGESETYCSYPTSREAGHAEHYQPWSIFVAYT